MKTKLPWFICLFAAGLMILATPETAAAQDQQEEAPPTRVANLDYMQGSVSYQPAGEQDWVDAELNRPLTTGDNLWSDQNSRAEVFIGSTALRMGDSTGISFLNLDDQTAQVQLAQGTLAIDVPHLNPNEAYEIDTPNLAFSIVQPGSYVVTADPNGGTTYVDVYSGQGTVTGQNQNFNVARGQRAVFSGTTSLSENVQPVPQPDAFVRWAQSREMTDEHSISSRYVAPGVTGYEDLDHYGSWHADSEYGNYWVPNDVSSGWVPYHTGHWCWIAPWGWTWVDAQPWGFAPFHYGRWAVINGSWGWVPGPVAVAPVYAPALVGFVGGGGFGVSVSFGSVQGVGWYPLGPRDIYVPAYRASPRYVQEINRCGTRYYNQTEITRVYNNYTVNHITYVNYTYANNPRAITAVNRQTFVSGQRVARGAIRLNQQQIMHPRVVTTASLTPTRSSVVGGMARARRAPRVPVATHRVVTRLKPSPRAQPLGRPRPATNPQLTNAALQRSGYSPQLQMIRARAAASAPARHVAPTAPAKPAAPGRAAPGRTQPNRPAPRPAPGKTTQPTPPAARPAPGRTQPAVPGRPAPTSRPARPIPPARTTPPARAIPPARTAPPRAPAAPPPHPMTRPAIPARPAPRPEENRPALPQPSSRPNTARPEHRFTPPNRPAARPNPNPPVRQPDRPPVAPNRPMPRTQPQPRPAMPPASRPAQPRPQPRQVRPPTRPEPRPAARPRPEPRPQPKHQRPPEKKKPGPGPGGDGTGSI
ncbi:MAG TPA: DUF6600 domain-containing protein [Candidatus Acidoferrales bacterium]|nr:DUF6600 domain-containing protein [Candidatus Acidoferrales bacterium]